MYYPTWRYPLTLLITGFALFSFISPALAKKHKLSDQELDQVVAGGLSTQVVKNVLDFDFQGQTANHQSLDAQGSIQVKKLNDASTPPGSLVITDSAQQNLHSFVNINAVNSKVQVFINLNININSTVGTLRQINLSGKY